MPNFSKNIALLALGFWLGCAVLFAAVVAPTLFNPEVASGLSRSMAGAISGAILRRVFLVTYISIGISCFFLLISLFGGGKGPRRAFILCILLLGLNAANDFWISDKLNKIKVQKTNETGTRVEALQKDFNRWHTAAEGLFGGTMICGALAALLLLPSGSGGKSSRKSR